MNTWVIIPIFNESKYIGNFLSKLKKITKNILVVDDGSTDNTQEVLRRLKVKYLTHSINLGKGAALRSGCAYAFNKLRAEYVVIMDGDGQHHPSDINRFYRQINSGNQLILGVRAFDAKMPVTRILGNKLTSIIINMIFGVYIADIPSGFKGFSREIFSSIVWTSNSYDVETEIAVQIAKNNIKFVEIPISTIYHGKESGFNLIDALRIVIKLPLWIWR